MPPKRGIYAGGLDRSIILGGVRNRFRLCLVSLQNGERHGLDTAYNPRCSIFGFRDTSCFRARWWWRWWRRRWLRWQRGIGVRIGRVSVKQCWRSVGSGRDNTEQPPEPVKIPARYARHWRKRVGWCWPVRFRRRQRVERIADRFAWLGQGVARESLVSRAMADFRRTQPQPKPSGPGKEKAAARTGARGAFPYRNCMLVFRLNPRLRPPNLEAGRGLCVASA